LGKSNAYLNQLVIKGLDSDDDEKSDNSKSKSDSKSDSSDDEESDDESTFKFKWTNTMNAVLSKKDLVVTASNLVKCCKANKKLPKNKKIYFEIILKNYNSGNIYIGICNENFGMNNWVGSTINSWAILISNNWGNAFHNGQNIQQNFCEKAKTGNVYGIVINTKKKTFHVFSNGKYNGIAHRNLTGVFYFINLFYRKNFIQVYILLVDLVWN
jgi:hypothetical protein